MGVPSGGDLGVARGRIEISTAQAEQVPSIMRGVAQQSAASMGALDAAAKRNEASLNAARAAMQALAATSGSTIAQARAAVQQFAAASAATQTWAATLNNLGKAGQSASAGLNAAIAAAIKASNTKYLIANAPAPVFAQPGKAGGLGGVANALGFGGGAASIAGGLGIATGAAAIAQAGRAVVAAEALATAYDRQSVAAENLAGSQVRLNDFLRVYEKATGGAIDQATALSNVTKLMSVGFADNAKELEGFATAIRGISIAMGASQDTVTQNLILELFTQRGARLDQLGLQYDKVRARADELAAADKSLTSQTAYQQAVLEQANQRFGKLADSAAGAATGIEKAEKAWADLNLKIGQTAQGPLDAVGQAFAVFFNFLSYRLDQEIAKMEWYIRQWQRLQHMLGNTTFSPDFAGGSGISDRARGNANRGVPGPPIIPGEAEAKLDWAKGVEDINKRLHDDIIDAENSYGQQRADAIRNYQKGVAREERDFQRTRLRAELEQLDAIADVWKEATRREARAAEDLARSLAQSRADADESIAEARENSNKRLADLDEDYQKEREKALRAHGKSMRDAAGRLDAKAIADAQADFAAQERDAKEAHDDQRQELAEALQERIADEEKALAKSNQRQQEAYDRQLADARANDALRLEEMKTDFAQRKAQEDEDRAIRRGDAAQDHADQLIEMDRVHGERITQINDHAQEERDALDLAHKEEMIALGVRNDAWLVELERMERARKRIYDSVWGTPSAGGLPPGATLPSNNIVPGLATPANAGGSSRSVNVGGVNISVIASNGQSPYSIAAEVRTQMENLLRELGNN